MRMAYKHAKNGMSPRICSSSYKHTLASKLQISQRVHNQTFVYSFVRDPTSQFVSEFFHFQVSRRGLEANVTNFINYEKQMYRSDVDIPQIHYLIPEIKEDNENEDIIQNMLDSYDFIGLTERLDESLVALRFILNLNADDILYV